MILSSAYRANRWFLLSISLSKSSRRMLLKSGDSGPPCGTPLTVRVNLPFTTTPARRYLTDKTQETLIPDSPGSPVHQDVVVDRIEELLKIKVYGIAVSLPYVFLDFPYRLVGGSANHRR